MFIFFFFFSTPPPPPLPAWQQSSRMVLWEMMLRKVGKSGFRWRFPHSLFFILFLHWYYFIFCSITNIVSESYWVSRGRELGNESVCVKKLFRKISYKSIVLQNSFAGGPWPLVDHKRQEQHPSQQGIWMCITIITQLLVLKSWRCIKTWTSQSRSCKERMCSSLSLYPSLVYWCMIFPWRGLLKNQTN